jgi:hypothetical protein
VGLVLVLFANQPNEDARFLLPLVPFVAVAVAIAVSRPPRILAVSAVLLLSLQFALVTLQSFGAVPIERMTYYRLAAPQRDPSLRHELERLVDTTCTASSAGRLSIVGAEHPWFNANTLSMIASARNSSVERKCYYTSLGYAEADASRAWDRVVTFNPPFFLTIDYGSTENRLMPSLRPDASRADAFNRVNRAVLERVRAASAFAVIPSSRRNGFVVFERVEDVR